MSLGVALSATEARAQKLETPGAPAAEAAPAPSTGPASFGDSGELVVSIERLFGYNWAHESLGSATGSANTYTLLGNPFGAGAYPYDWPRLGLDYFVMKSISVGAAVAFARTSSGSASANELEVAPRIGYGMMVGPWLGVWPRAGVTYVYTTNQSYLGLTIDLAAVIDLAPHFAITFAPVANIGLSGSQKGPAGTTTDLKFTTLGAQFGLAMAF
ncbi:MAG TPA: hypothetical protein VH853_00940 [Polyangia bacterium]|nr:hypothetical protein [Polyangia bacterium]